MHTLPLLLLGLGRHQVESRPSLEPLDLTLVEGMGEGDFVLGTICMLGDQSKVLAWSKGFETEDVDLVVRTDLVVVFWVGESQGKHTLLLQVGLVDTSERANDDSETTKVSGLKSSVLAGRTLSVVMVTDNDPLDSLGLVVCGSLGDGVVLAGELVLNLVGFAILRVDSTNQKVLRDVLKVTTVLEPRTTSTDVVSGALALDLD